MKRTSRLLRILVVDDAQVMAHALTVILAEHGYNATPTSSEEEALVLCRRKRPDVVIIGATLGTTVSSQLAIQIVTRLPKCKVLRISDDGLSLTHPRTPDSADDDFPAFAIPIDSRGILDYLETLSSQIQKR